MVVRQCTRSIGKTCNMSSLSLVTDRFPLQRTLRVNHSTVLRRINMLEERQGVRLFDRLRSGYQLNLDGQQLLQAAQSIEETVVGLER